MLFREEYKRGQILHLAYSLLALILKTYEQSKAAWCRKKRKCNYCHDAYVAVNAD
jgi:hypothetical protein